MKNGNNWNEIIETSFQEHSDVYFNFEYFELYSKYYDVKPEGIFWEDDNVKIFWSHLIRNLHKIEPLKKYNYKDFITPYGYGGPLIYPKNNQKGDVQKSIQKFFKDYYNWAQANNYICEFIRFHPILENWKYLKGIIEVNYINDVVAIDLTESIEQIWRNMSKNTRYYSKKVQEEFEDIIIIKNPSKNEIDEFVSLYNETMDKNKASKKYYFSIDFIKDHFKLGTLLIYCKNKDNVLGSSAMFLKGSKMMHYHLSATNYNFKISPTRAILWSAINRAKESGLKWFHLGGGRAENDSLFQFKKGFSKIIFPFHIGKIIFNNKVYDELTSLNSFSKQNPNFFPLYRVGYDDTIL